MNRLIARLRRFVHCTTTFHRAITMRGAHTFYYGCECGKVFYDNSPPGYADYVLCMYGLKKGPPKFPHGDKP